MSTTSKNQVKLLILEILQCQGKPFHWKKYLKITYVKDVANIMFSVFLSNDVKRTADKR